jgi:hypothetical protein
VLSPCDHRDDQEWRQEKGYTSTLQRVVLSDRLVGNAVHKAVKKSSEVECAYKEDTQIKVVTELPKDVVEYNGNDVNKLTSQKRYNVLVGVS